MPKGPDILQSPSSSSSLFSLPPAQPGAVSLSNQKFTPSKLLTQLVELSLNIERTDVSNPDSHFPNLVTGQHGAWSISIPGPDPQYPPLIARNTYNLSENLITSNKAIIINKAVTKIGISSIQSFYGCIDSVEDPSLYIKDIKYTVKVEVNVEEAVTDKHYRVLFQQNLRDRAEKWFSTLPSNI